MLDHIRVDQRLSRTSSRGLFASWAVLSAVLMVFHLSFNETIGPGKVRGRCGMV